jgi:putative FmdB family regulatory protein
MPIYEYRCEACGHQEEFLQRVTEPPLTECPVCRKPTFQKLLSAAGFQLKGSGWYATDFKNKTSKPAEKKAEDKSEAKPDAKPDAKPEAKPEKKTESKSEAAA